MTNLIVITNTAIETVTTYSNTQALITSIVFGVILIAIATFEFIHLKKAITYLTHE